MSNVYEKLKAMVGEASELIASVDKVDRATIRHWCEAIQDGNPMYTDEAYAENSKYKGIIAPPQMVQSYTMKPIWPKSEEKGTSPLGKAVDMMNEAGYFAVVATNTSHTYFAPMRPGDRIFQKVKLASVSPEKKTGLGTGHFVTVEQTYTNQKEEVVCVQSFTVLLFKP